MTESLLLIWRYEYALKSLNYTDEEIMNNNYKLPMYNMDTSSVVLYILTKLLLDEGSVPVGITKTVVNHKRAHGISVPILSTMCQKSKYNPTACTHQDFLGPR